ncbi:MAG TPA: methyltransferase domain-containing protein [Candidatus Saccharimonadales bacterium]|nr:methyltransferase domain-containing protein [Candidatus Saccharimonadales bacterium]
MPIRRSDIQKQFAATAPGYAASDCHAHGATLQVLVELAQVQAGDWVLDLATGTAHSAMALPPAAGVVVGLDLTLAMMREGRAMADERGLGHLRFVAGDAQELPFADAAFDRVVSRIAPHHFLDIGAALREVRRVLRPGGRFAMIDNSTPGDPVTDLFVDTLERLHDPTHVRAYSPAEWRSLCREAGLTVLEVREDLYDVLGGRSMAEWAARSHCTAEVVAKMSVMMRNAPPEVKEALRIRERGFDIYFDMPRVGLAAMKA